MKSPFTITPRVIAHLGEDLIKNESIAILELVKNSYDAFAHNCNVYFHFGADNELERISIEDDGTGMSIDTVKNVWLVIGTDNKKKIMDMSNGVNLGRMPLGEKGIGRLGVHKLGEKISMYTKTRGGNEVTVKIDWSKLYTSKSVDDFRIDVDETCTPLHFDGTYAHGTKIYITSLKGQWDRRKLRSVYRDLTSLNSPFSNKNDSFIVNVTSNNNIFRGLPNVEEILNVGMYKAHCVIIGDRITDFNYEFRPWKSLTRIHGRKINNLQYVDSLLIRRVEDVNDNGRIRSHEEYLDLSYFNIGPIQIDVVIFEKDVSVFSYLNTEKTSLNEYLRENGGMRVYRDDVRVYNYGERDNDWLGLDHRRMVRAGGTLSSAQLIGSVGINRFESADLKEKTNREGFIENDAYFAFVDAVKYAMDKICLLRNEDKFNLMSIYKSTSKVSEPVVGDLNEVMEIVEKAVENEKDKATIKNYLIRIGKQYKEVRDTLIKSANAGLNLGVAVHEIEKNVARLKGLAERGEIEEIKTLALHLEKIVAGYSVFLSNSDIKATDLAQIAKIVIDNNMFRFSDHKIKIFSNYKRYVGKALLSKSETIASLTNLIDNAIYWVSRSRDTDRMIYVYLTDDIDGYASIAVCDNGPGFTLSPEMAMQPFVTAKPMNTGMGLGLHITNEVMAAMNGKLQIMDSYDLELPERINDYTDNPTVVVLSFPPAK